MATIRPTRGLFAAIDSAGRIVLPTISTYRRDTRRLAGDWAFCEGTDGWKKLKREGYRIGRVDVVPTEPPVEPFVVKIPPARIE